MKKELEVKGKIQSYIKNSTHFIKTVNNVCLRSDEMMVSFDVSSLFTNVPIDEAVSVIRDKLQNDESLDERTCLSPECITELLEICLRSTYFRYNRNCYEQVDGAAMGSPVSALVANLYKEFFEEEALNSAPVKPVLWKRYVDDTFCIVKKGSEKHLLDHLYSVRPSIKFTMESEEDSKLPFLDFLLKRESDGMLTSTVKPTQTNRFLHFKSHHPNHVKRGVVRGSYQRARRVTNMSDNLKEEEKHLHKVLQSNGYDNNTTIRAGSKELPSKDHTNTEQEKGLFLTISTSIAGLSESIQRVCREFDIETVFKSGKTLRSHLTKVKDTIPITIQSHP